MKRILMALLLSACGGSAESAPLECCQTSAGYRWSTGEQTLTLQCNRRPASYELPGMECDLDNPLEDGDYACVFE